MKLETAGSLSSEDVTIEELRQACGDVRGRGDFLILSSGEQHYMQVAGLDEPFVIEYREGSEAEHYEGAQEFCQSEMEAILVAYLMGECAWKSMYQWRKIEKKPWWRFW